MPPEEDAKKAFDLFDRMRVIINDEGERAPYERARDSHGIRPDVIFIRDDRWGLGALYKHEDIAYNLWAESWSHVYVVNEKVLTKIADYKK